MLLWATASIHSAPPIHIARSESGVCRVSLGLDAAGFAKQLGDGEEAPRDALLVEAIAQLRKYFSRKLRDFDIPLDLEGTDFQMRVWRALLTIPYGETWSYAQLANRLGVPKAFRAVGSANGRNPIPIIVPCHRVIQTGGGLGGYGGGLHLKRMLLEIEGAKGYQDRFQAASG
jgi:methylated-DNA-[protein]-cysteine S-methyltransferase